ncbi:N-alpha-acetyltransferase 50 [Senna tora]|uniref:N-alpha-acetyltransferase 50 n=1 Tax=Senna tora TaxID=362788 RepID=A0A834WW31_9FABA|nr:N-alpha-acetyltransferase 50 [Senna tora]
MGIGREVSISLDSVRDENLMQLRKLNTVIFPVRYNQKYYADALASGEFTKLAYYNDTCAGAIACRLEKKEDGVGQVYIMTLGVLAPYRGLGIGTRMLNHVLEVCSRENTSENSENLVYMANTYGYKYLVTVSEEEVFFSVMPTSIAIALEAMVYGAMLLPQLTLWDTS